MSLDKDVTIEEVRAQAPENATHYEIDGDEVIYLLCDEGVWYADDGNYCWWVLFSGDFEYYNKNAKPL